MKHASSHWQKWLRQNSFTMKDWLLVMILGVGIFLRMWNVEHTMIFFADAGRDMLAAVEMNSTGQIPLLGIPSSDPRFKQGPLFIWFEAFIFRSVGVKPVAVIDVVVLINSIALLGCYFLLKRNFSAGAALVGTLLLATSPLAIAHSRMPYHITPIIACLLLYLWTLQRLIEQKKFAVYWAVLGWVLLFQFELALFPLILLIPFLLWRKKYWRKTMAIQSSLALTIGLLPQIIFDLHHHFAQLGGFGLWLVRRFIGFFWIGRQNSVSVSALNYAWHTFFHYFSRIFSLDHTSMSLIVLAVIVLCVVMTLQHAKKNMFAQTVVLSFVILFSALFIQGMPSEAYFPPIILLSCMLIGIGTSYLRTRWKIISYIGVLILATINTVEIVKNNFFVLPATSTFQYGPSYYEQTQIMQFILNKSKGNQYQLRSTDPEAHFETYLDNYRLIGLSLSQTQLTTTQASTRPIVFYLNKRGSELNAYPLATITFFPNVEVIELPESL